MCDLIIVFIPHEIPDESLDNKLLISHFFKKIALLFEIYLIKRFTKETLFLGKFYLMFSYLILLRKL